MKKESIISVMLLAFLASSCATHYPRLQVVGYAENAKLGAIIVTDADSIYFISGKEYWTSDTLGMRLKVYGRLETKINKSRSTDSIKYAEILRQNIIHKARIDVP